MFDSKYVAAAAVPVGVFALLLSVCFWRRRRSRCEEEPGDFVGASRRENSQTRVVKTQPTTLDRLHQPDLDSRRRPSNSVYPRGVSSKPFFSWSDHPLLVNDAVENGWSQFAFIGWMSSSPSSRSRLLGLCSTGDGGRETSVEMSWEVCQESADFMQKISLNPGLIKKPTSSLSSQTASVIRTALPLPGPPLASFPQEAYFEITILSISDDCESISTLMECERAKLIQVQPSSEPPDYFSGGNKVNNVEELKGNGKYDGRGEAVTLSIGLSSGGPAPSKLPGSYSGSIGFNSNGSVFLDGIKLVFESEKEDWGRTERVIGCGFDPNQKKVFFTVDSELVHVINCKSEEFGYPLYPTMSANGEVMLIVNFGQSVFKYSPAQRTANPCFTGPPLNARRGDIGYEDSRELFSMGMIDSHWFDRTQSIGFTDDEDEASDEIELFEIVVEEAEILPNKIPNSKPT